MYRNGLSIAMFAARPYMRRDNIATIRIDEQIVREGSSIGCELSSDDMKGRIGRGGPLPEMALTPFVERYIKSIGPFSSCRKPDVDGTFSSHAWASHLSPLDVECNREASRKPFLAVGFARMNFVMRPEVRSQRRPRARRDSAQMLGHADYSTSESYYISPTSMPPLNGSKRRWTNWR